MASEDVIELGSSDEEAEPAPKKAKPRPNAMVHIPNKLPGINVKLAKPKSQPNPFNKLIGKGVTVRKVNNAPKQPNSSIHGRAVSNPTAIKTKRINPACVMPRIGVSSHSPIINRVFPTMQNIRPQHIKIAHNVIKNANFMRNPLKMQPVRVLNNLLPSVTITKTNPGLKRKAAVNISNLNKNKKTKIAPTRDTVLTTVELDDDEPPTASTSNPQWYLRPEEQTEDKETNNLEEKNNAEPDTSKFIEITIEDSPIKPIQDKRTHEIGAELAITIDDSPHKTLATEDPGSAESDDGKREEPDKVPHSKKKLDYLQEAEPEKTTIEIEVEPINNHEDNNDLSNDKEVQEDNVANDNFIEIFESPVKTIQHPPNTPKKDNKSESKSVEVEQTSTQPGEFHPVYQQFIDLCFQLENSTDMQTIVEKKIKSYYKQVPKEYTESEEFIDVVSSKILAMRASPEKLYLYIKDIVDELNLQRKMAKAQPTVKDAREIEAEKFQYGEDSEFDSKRQRQIRKLEKTLKKLHRAIQKLEEQEVDFDDDEDSVYLLTESDDSSSSIKDVDKQLEKERSMLLKRYKERMVRVHAKFCQLTNTKMPSEPKIHIDPRPGQPAGPAKRLEKWVNKKVPIGKPLPFPDFHDVLHCVKEANVEDKLGWNDVDIMEEARDLFTRCGKKLQRRRQENEWRLAASRISSEVDPAETSDALKKKLEMNKQLASKKEADVVNKYADKQSQMNLEAVEIGDKEAEESPVESEDEEPSEEKGETLENKEKRKERLRRLIQEKSKKSYDFTKSPNEPSGSPSGAVDSDEKEDERIENLSESKDMEVDVAPLDVNKETVEIDTDSQDANADAGDKPVPNDTTHSISDNSKVDSDVDELHLLQKLHSDEVNTSTVDSSDSDSPVDISDSIPSSDNKVNPTSDIISIENSSYSESEQKDDNEPKDTEMTDKETLNKLDSEVISGEIECSSDGIQVNKTNNEEYNESVESILLASTDDESGDDSNGSPNGECVNLKDDNISIGETVVQEAETSAKSITKDSNSTVVDNDTVGAKDIKLKQSISSSDKESEVTPSPTGESLENETCESEDLNAKDDVVEECILSDDSTKKGPSDNDVNINKSTESLNSDPPMDSNISEGEKQKNNVEQSEQTAGKLVTSEPIVEKGKDAVEKDNNAESTESPSDDLVEKISSDPDTTKVSSKDRNEVQNITDKSESLETMLKELQSDLAVNDCLVAKETT